MKRNPVARALAGVLVRVSDPKWYFAVLALLPLVLAAQQPTAHQEIEQINKAYAALTQLRTEVDYVMYATHTGTKTIDRQTAVMARSDDAYFYKLGPVETLTTALYTVAADHEDKELVLDKVRGNPREKQFGIEPDVAIAACDTVILSEPAPGQRMIRMDLPMADVERVEFRYGAKDYLMQKVTLYYREAEEWDADKAPTKARMEIIYRKQDAQPVFAKDLFSIERFVRKSESGFVPDAAFKTYTFFDNTQF